jgi:ribonuclease T1
VPFFTRLRAGASATLVALLVAVASLGLSCDASARGGALAFVHASDLPREARQTLTLIRAGGPFPYERDGIVFANFERQLPRHERGYYHEYTVRTPGVADRGARRIIIGASGELYYTADHYRTFRQIVE